MLTRKAVAACRDQGVDHLLIGGGVAANSRLRAMAEERCEPRAGIAAAGAAARAVHRQRRDGRRARRRAGRAGAARRRRSTCRPTPRCPSRASWPDAASAPRDVAAATRAAPDPAPPAGRSLRAGPSGLPPATVPCSWRGRRGGPPAPATSAGRPARRPREQVRRVGPTSPGTTTRGAGSAQVTHGPQPPVEHGHPGGHVVLPEPADQVLAVGGEPQVPRRAGARGHGRAAHVVQPGAAVLPSLRGRTPPPRSARPG